MIEEQNEDKLLDQQARKFLEELKQVGPFSK
jgi:hypothetical protein